MEHPIAQETTPVIIRVFVMIVLTLPNALTASLDGWDQPVVTPVYTAHLTPQVKSVSVTPPVTTAWAVTLSAPAMESATATDLELASVIHWSDGVEHTVKFQDVPDILKQTLSVRITVIVTASLWNVSVGRVGGAWPVTSPTAPENPIVMVEGCVTRCLTPQFVTTAPRGGCLVEPVMIRV